MAKPTGLNMLERRARWGLLTARIYMWSCITAFTLTGIRALMTLTPTSVWTYISMVVSLAGAMFGYWLIGYWTRHIAKLQAQIEAQRKWDNA